MTGVAAGSGTHGAAPNGDNRCMLSSAADGRRTATGR